MNQVEMEDSITEDEAEKKAVALIAAAKEETEDETEPVCLRIKPVLSGFNV